MPRYYFDSEYQGSVYSDPEGIELASLDVARQHSDRLARDITYDDAESGERKVLLISLRCDGEVVLSYRVGDAPGSAPLAS